MYELPFRTYVYDADNAVWCVFDDAGTPLGMFIYLLDAVKSVTLSNVAAMADGSIVIF